MRRAPSNIYMAVEKKREAYLVVNIAVLGLHDLDGTHLGISHPLNIIRLLNLELRVVVLGVLQVQIVNQETLVLSWRPLCQRCIRRLALSCLVIYCVTIEG